MLDKLQIQTLRTVREHINWTQFEQLDMDKILTKVGQTILSYVSNISMKTFGQNLDIAWTFLCPKFVQYKKLGKKRSTLGQLVNILYKIWTII